MEAIVLGLFLAGLLICIVSGLPVIGALLWGVCLFGFYAHRNGFSFQEILRMFWSGAQKTRNIMVVFVCIGCLTAVWRISGTIPYIVYHAAGMIVPKYFILCAFVLCAFLSVMTGSSFSTASTIGSICMMLGLATGIAPLPLAGAILSGSFFGDRWSPMSTSAHLVATITHTEIYSNLKTMLRTGAFPLAVTLLIYLLMGSEPHTSDIHVLAVFERSFQLSWLCMLPAAVVLAMCLLRMDVKYTMIASTLAGVLLAAGLQKVPWSDIFLAMLRGFQPDGDAELSALLAGGGICSMVNVGMIVFISSSFSGVFEKTALLDGVGHVIEQLIKRTTRETAFLITSVIACMIACNQTLATLLTEQLVRPWMPDDSERASFLEDTSILIAPLFPWNIAGAVPLAVLGVGSSALPYACYLYLIPLWFLVRHLLLRHKSFFKSER